MKPLVAFAQNLRNYIDGIVTSCQYEINTSVLEGVNNRIKQIKRRAYGFHDDYYFYLKVKLRSLDFRDEPTFYHFRGS